MLRLVLDWCSRNRDAVPALRFLPGSRWYSEALLPSQFFSDSRGDGVGEGYTHADAVIGHFRMRQGGRGDIEIARAGAQLVVVEAKMGSLLSAGTTNAKKYDQAARNVACVVKLVGDSGRHPSQYARLGFFVLAPQQRLREGAFAPLLDKAHIERTVRERAAAFRDARHERWLQEVFAPTLAVMDVDALSWEDVLAAISAFDPGVGSELEGFYRRCLVHNPLTLGKAAV